MIDLYTCDTPNGRKVSIFLEETGLDYTTHVVDIRSGEHKEPAFRKINPNMKIPTIVDQYGPAGAPIRVFESGAILQYLAEKSGRFMGNDARNEGGMPAMAVTGGNRSRTDFCAGLLLAPACAQRDDAGNY